MNLRVLKSQLSQLMHIWTNRIRSQELPTDGPLDEDGLCFVMALEGLSWSWQGFIVQAMLWLRLPAPYIKKLCSSLAKDMYVRTYMYIYACFLIQCLALKLLGIRHLVGNSSANFYFRVRNGWVSIHTTFFWISQPSLPANVALGGGAWAGGVTFQECFGAVGCELASAAEAGGGMDDCHQNITFWGPGVDNPGQSSIFSSFLHYLVLDAI